MKKTLLLTAIVLFCLPAFSARYLVQTGVSGAASWTRTLDASETLVDLTVNAQSLNAWLASVSFSNGDEVWIAAGKYTFTAAYTYPTRISVYGGFIGTETVLTERAKGTKTWNFVNETMLDGNNNTTQIFTPGGARAGSTIDGLTITNAGAGTGAALVGRDGMTIQNCQFINNKSTGNGGGLLLNGGGNLSDSYFSGNKANSGGGVHIGTGANLTSYVNNCLFDSNQAIGGANNLGGALRSQATGLVNIEKCIFKNNDAVGNGSAVHIQLSAVSGTQNTILSNCLIYGNTTKGGIYMIGGILSNCTVVENTVGGVYIGNATIASAIKNTVFWGSSSSGTVTSVASNASAIIQNTAYTSIQSSNLIGSNNTNNIQLDAANTGSTTDAFYPAFSDPSTNDYTLLSTSSLINAGQTISTVTDDIAGFARPYGNAYDIGAYEFSTATGINQLESSTFKYLSTNSGIELTEIESGNQVQVYSLNGVSLYNKIAAGSHISIPLNQGIYIVRVADQAAKVIVK